ncbi:hypothetical protein Acy02nite_82760 [Actinoplanes cyaneus]|uniref:Uncharacterized protein n=1 Tax=Actinoplanes cyaneus TaxID=52696 RepID=A0A919IQK7_9ACTN|nr:hypothetical protein Acy02nite_82760 [Actinoplanes cyaneus]
MAAALEADAVAHGIGVMRLGTYEATALHPCAWCEGGNCGASPYGRLAFEKMLVSCRE